jgi:hypothetical protein
MNSAQIGFDIVPIRHLRRPHLEKDRGAGYINVSARERNSKLMAAARSVYFSGRKIFVPEWFVEEFTAALEKGSL